MRIILKKGQFFMMMILERGFVNLEVHHHIGCFDKLFSVFSGKDSEGVFGGWYFD